MFRIPKIENGTFYFDQIIREMGDYATKEREKIKERFDKSVGTFRKNNDDVNLDKRKDLELQKIRYINEKTNLKIRKIISSFPKFTKIDPIYTNLINTTHTKVSHIQDALARLLWIANTMDEFTQNTEHKIKYAKSQQTVGFIMKKYLGKANSLFKKNNSFFKTLDDAAKFMNSLPKFEEMYTVAIAGFPNVGKSTLMKKITGSDVEIQNYPFTTKGLMFGYIKSSDKKIIQMIDTPGLLGREKSNEIEEKANVIIAQYSNQIIFVLDFTESCGYESESQIKLLKKIANMGKQIKIYLSKTDIYDEESIEKKNELKNKIKRYKIYENFEKIKEDIIKEMLNQKSKFDPTKIKLIK